MNIALAELPLWVALLPLAAYLLLLGGLHVRRRPMIFSGPFDAVMLAAAVSGLVVAGPLALLQPAAGTSVWTAVVLLLAFVLLVAFALLAARPRLVVYNVGIDQLRPIIVELVTGLDGSARWAGETVALPARGLQLHLDDRGPARTVSIIAGGSQASAESWAEFSRRLRRAIRPLRVKSSPWAAVFAGLGVALLLAAIWFAIGPPRGESARTTPREGRSFPRSTSIASSDA
jgi:hypothetical protein